MRIRAVLVAAAAVAAAFTAVPEARADAQADAPNVWATHYNESGGAGLVGPMATASFAWGLKPADLQRVYAIPAATGSPTVAVVIAYDNPNIEADLNAYRSQFGLPACTTANGCFKKVNQTGGTTYPTADVGWAQESALDVEMVSAACPNCKILLVETNSPSFNDLLAGIDYAAANANYISNSWGTTEFSQATYYESRFNKPGKVITFSTGDDGHGVAYPASSQYVVAVGGTSLQLDWAGNRSTETAWSGAGSGCSSVIPKPSWQKDTGCAKRALADVSAVADPNTGVAVYSSYGSTSGNWWVFGGTSASAPLLAGIYAASAGKTLAPLRDITSGTNGICSVIYLCNAIVGYDGPTGLGVPNGATAPPAIALNKAPVVTSKTKSCSTTGPTCTFTVNAYDPEAKPVSYIWTNFASTTKTATFTFTGPGTKTVTAGVKDGVKVTHASVSVTCAAKLVSGVGWRNICS